MLHNSRAQHEKSGAVIWKKKGVGCDFVGREEGGWAVIFLGLVCYKDEKRGFFFNVADTTIK
jgi:hypothetical protein